MLVLSVEEVEVDSGGARDDCYSSDSCKTGHSSASTELTDWLTVLVGRLAGGAPAARPQLLPRGGGTSGTVGTLLATVSHVPRSPSTPSSPSHNPIHLLLFFLFLPFFIRVLFFSFALFFLMKFFFLPVILLFYILLLLLEAFVLIMPHKARTPPLSDVVLL